MRWAPMFIAAAAALLLSCASAGYVTAENEIRQVEAEWNQSRIAGNARRVAGLLDDGWTMVHVDGHMEDKKSYVEGIASGGRHILSIDVVAQSIRIEPPVAVVAGEVVQRGFRRGEMREGRLRYTHVWLRRGSLWQMLRSDSTEVRDSAPVWTPTASPPNMRLVYTLAVWRVKPGRESDFIAAWKALDKAFAALPHPPSGKGTLVQSTSDPSLFYSFGAWNSVEDIQAMRANPDAQAGIGRLRELCTEATPGTFRVVAESGS